MSKFILILAFSLFLESPSVFGSTILAGITSKRIGSDFFVEISFSEDISGKNIKVEYTDQNIAVIVPDATAAGKRTFKSIKDTTVDHIQAFHRTDDSIAFRMTLTKPFTASQFEKTTSLISKSNRVLLKIGDPDTKVAAAQIDKEKSGDTPGDLQGDLAGAQIDKLMNQETKVDNTKGAESIGTQKEATAVTAVGAKGAKAELEENTPVFKNDQLGEKEKGTTGKSLWGRMIMSLVVVLSILGGGFYAMKKWPGSKKMATRNRMIEIMAQHPLGPKKSIAVIRVAGETVLVGITDNNISILKTLTLLDEEKFQSALDKKVNPPKNSEEDEFSMKGLKDIVSDRLKNMRRMS